MFMAKSLPIWLPEKKNRGWIRLDFSGVTHWMKFFMLDGNRPPFNVTNSGRPPEFDCVLRYHAVRLGVVAEGSLSRSRFS